MLRLRHRTDCRSGILPERRRAFVGVVASAVALGAVVDAAPAAADPGPTVVTATVFDAAAHAVTPGSVTLSALQSCPVYAGSSPMVLEPSGQPFQPAAGSSWALSTVLTCGLQIPLANVSDVVVARMHGFDAPLSAAQLTGGYQDPDALPVISVDGGEDQNTYFRPYLGGADVNGADYVVQQGAPVAIEVYEGSAPLAVTAAQRPVSSTATTAQVAMAATVADATGAAIPASALTWSWDFGDGTTSRIAAPVHGFPAGTSIVTVQVTDPATGQGGTATLDVSAQVTTSPHGRVPTGGGNTRKKSTSRTGADNSHGTASSGKRGATKTSTTTSTTSTTSTSTSTTSATTTTTPAASTTSTTTPTTSTTPTGPARTSPPSRPRAATRPPRRAAHRATHPAAPAGTTLVTGRLVADVVPLTPGASQLVHTVPAATVAAPAPAPAARRAASAAATRIVLAALAILALLALGAARELRGGRDWRTLRFGG